MNVEPTQTTQEQVPPQGEQGEQEQAEAPLSIAEHTRQFGPQANPGDPGDPGDAPEADRLPHRSDTQKREQGKFAPGHKRTPRNDWQAKVDQLTGRVKDTSEKLTTAERERDEARAELSRLKAEGGSRLDVQRQEQRVEKAEAKVERHVQASSTFAEPAPTDDDPKYAGDYGAYLEDRAAWRARKEYHDLREQERQEAVRAQSQKQWDDRLTATRAKYQDFDAVADRVIAQIPKGSPVEAWIFSHKLGDDVLYYFDSHPHDLDAILRMATPLEQFEAVTLLAHQHFGASTRPGPAAATTSAAGRPYNPPPKPPNVVRTEAQSPGKTPPPTDGSLSIAEHAKHFGPKRR